MGSGERAPGWYGGSAAELLDSVHPEVISRKVRALFESAQGYCDVTQFAVISMQQNLKPKT